MIHVITLFILCFLCLFESTQSQYMQFNRNTQNCEGTRKTALVEHFFNLIFTEFHSTPPVCVCVQFCADQSTYCYPNGCLKLRVKKVIDEPVSRIQNYDSTSQIFLVERKNDYVTDFVWKRDPEESITGVKTDTIKNIRPDPFKDKYKTALRYKKRPQVELRYNLREQVKNMKMDLLRSEKADVSKTRWPSKKRSKLNRYTFLSIDDSSSPITKTNTFFMSILPDKDVVNYPPRYTKRELKKANNTVEDQQTVFIDSQANDTLQNTSFSIENLISDLVENNFRTNKVDVGINLEDNNENDELRETKNNRTFKNNLRNLQDNITSNNILFMNLSNEILDQSKYNEFNEMIANLSKKIDLQNNTSLEMMRRVTGGVEVVQINVSNELPTNTSGNSKTIAYNKTRDDTKTLTQEMEETTSHHIVSEDVISVNASFPSKENEYKILKKSRQRARNTLQKKKTKQNV